MIVMMLVEQNLSSFTQCYEDEFKDVIVVKKPSMLNHINGEFYEKEQHDGERCSVTLEM